jgi:hypothetical protein
MEAAEGFAHAGPVARDVLSRTPEAAVCALIGGYRPITPVAQGGAERDRVLERTAGTLAEEGEHRMGGVAEL